jgi:tetratricopeptide (TPR) repeat protein
MSFLDDLKHFLDKAADNVEALVDPHLSELKSKFSSLTSQYDATRSSVLDELTTLQSKKDFYKQFLGYQIALSLISRSVHWSDEEFSKVLQDASQDTPSLNLPYSLFLEPSQAQELTRCLGSNLLLPIFHSLSMYKLLGDSLLTRHLKEISKNVTLMESTLQIVQYTSPFYGVLGNILSKEIEYQDAISRLQEGINKLNYDLARIKSVNESLNKAIKDIRMSFMDLVTQLNRIQKASFNWQLQPEDSDKSYLSAMGSAASQYGIIMKLRLDWQRISANSGGNPSYLNFVQDEIMRRDRSIHTAKQVWQFITLIRQSSGTLTNAWEKEGCPENFA